MSGVAVFARSAALESSHALKRKASRLRAPPLITIAMVWAIACIVLGIPLGSDTGLFKRRQLHGRNYLITPARVNRLSGRLRPRFSLRVSPEYRDLNLPRRRNSGTTSSTKSLSPLGMIAGNTLNPSAAR